MVQVEPALKKGTCVHRQSRKPAHRLGWSNAPSTAKSLRAYKYCETQVRRLRDRAGSGRHGKPAGGQRGPTSANRSTQRTAAFLSRKSCPGRAGLGLASKFNETSKRRFIGMRFSERLPPACHGCGNDQPIITDQPLHPRNLAARKTHRAVAAAGPAAPDENDIHQSKRAHMKDPCGPCSWNYVTDEYLE